MDEDKAVEGAQEERPEPVYRMAWIGGNCPVQGHGTCCGGRPFYVRARGEGVQLYVSKEPKALDGEGLDHWFMGAADDEMWVVREQVGT